MAGGTGVDRLPRLLVTGFSVFPGAPVNPTQWLVEALAREKPAGVSAFRAELLTVEYDGMAERLSALGRAFPADIVIHFGLARAARGFRLERIARNAFSSGHPDNAGRLPTTDRICTGADMLPSSLPLDEIALALRSEGLPVEFSDDAGGYLCNMVFMLSRSHACEGFSPEMSGFVHVPCFPENAVAGEASLSKRELFAGSRIVIEETAAAWCKTRRAA